MKFARPWFAALLVSAVTPLASAVAVDEPNDEPNVDAPISAAYSNLPFAELGAPPAPANEASLAALPAPPLAVQPATMAAAVDPANLPTNAADGVRLDESIVPVVGNFQINGYGGPRPPQRYPTINISGAAQIDAIWFAQDEANRDVVGDAQDVAGFRRARLGALGQLADNVAYKIEYDFGFPGRPNFTDVWVDVAELPTVGHVRIGQWKQPFSMEPATSFREIMFMERSLAFALVPFRQIGVGVYDTLLDEAATYAISVYRFPTDAFGNAAGDGGYGMTTRETMLLWSNDCGDTLHLGASYTCNTSSTDTIRIRSTPEVGFTQLDVNNVSSFPIPFFVDTGVLPLANYQVIGAELATGVGSLLFQSEIMCAMVNQQGAPFLQLPAGYAQLGYVLTGERREYNTQAAAYGRVVPNAPFGKGGPGAIEVAGRYSVIDLNDANVQGGRLQDLTFGVNWYLNKFTRLEFNYVNPVLDRPADNETHADVFGTRAQFDF
jgi:phosphate-selective porin OprO and OprP